MRQPIPDDSASENHLNDVLTGYLKEVEGGLAPSREDLLARYPDLAADLREFFNDQDQVNRFTAPLRPVGKASRITAGIGSLETLQKPGHVLQHRIAAGLFDDYDLLETIAAGGMAVVYKARHRKLDRPVALKVLLAGGFAQPADLQRFRNEAETIAALDHPSIVPIYEVGERDGQLFLSLRFLEGGTLADQLPRYAADPRAAAALLIAIARAVHHAHQRGVLHRDLKPSNILLDADGRPHVADFGLARRQDHDSSLTQTGAILGTPCYMAPEQTHGGRDPLSTAADVYGLGGILYALLTGGPPFQRDDVWATMADVRTCVPESPRLRNPRVSRDLATICLKCLEKEPGRRYRSAEELATDLGRFLRNEPTRARPTGPVRRLGMWARRRPVPATLAAATGLFVVSFVTAALVYNLQLGEAVRQAVENENKARRHQRLAAQNYREARDTIDKMLARLEGRGVADVPRMKELSQVQIEDALTFYQRALDALDEPDAEVRRDTAAAYRRAADIQQTMGNNATAAENYRRAIGLLSGLPPEVRDTPDTQSLLSGCHMNLALSAQNRRLRAEAEHNHREALAIDERQASARPNDPGPRGAVAEQEHTLGSLYQLMDRPDEAERHYSRSVALRAGLIRECPGVPSYREGLAGDYINLGSIFMNSNRRREARDAYKKAEELLTALNRADPEKDTYRLALAATYSNWSYVVWHEGLTKDALDLLGKAVGLTEGVLAREPNCAVARGRAYNAHGTRAKLYEQLGRFPEAVEDWDRVVELDGDKDAWVRRALRATAMAKAGYHARATAEVAVLEKNPAISPDGLYHLGTVCALSIDAAIADDRLAADERPKVIESYAVRAIELLRQLKAVGYFIDLPQLFELAVAPDLKPLRNREDFKRLFRSADGPGSK